MIWLVTLVSSIAQLHGVKFAQPLLHASALPGSLSGAGCADQVEGCIVHKVLGGCTDQNPQHDHYRTVCAATCGLCPKAMSNPSPLVAPGVGPAVVDSVGPAVVDSSTDRHLGFTICGDAWKYTHQAERLVKSLILTMTGKYTKVTPASKYHLWIFVDDAAEAALKPNFTKLQHVASRSDDGHKKSFSINFLNVRPLDAKYGNDMNLFARCGLTPMILQDLLPSNVMELQFFGADQVIVDDLEYGLMEAKLMGWDGSKTFGMAEECVEPRGKCGWYNMRTQFKFGHNGFNSGSTLYSIQNMRKQAYAQWLNQSVQKYRPSLTLGDQDLINLYAQEHPNAVSALQCNLDLRFDSGCDVTKKPPLVLHGNRNTFDTMPEWRAVGEKVDALYQLLESKGQNELPGNSVWDAVGSDIRTGFLNTLTKPWGLTPISVADLLKPAF